MRRTGDSRWKRKQSSARSGPDGKRAAPDGEQTGNSGIQTGDLGTQTGNTDREYRPGIQTGNTDRGSGNTAGESGKAGGAADAR